MLGFHVLQADPHVPSHTRTCAKVYWVIFLPPSAVSRRQSAPSDLSRCTHSMVLQAIKYESGSLKLLDQRKLPLEETWISVDSVQTAWSAIKDMVVRGAPAIAIAAALALAAQLVASDAGHQFSSAKEAAQHVKEELEYLVTRWVLSCCLIVLIRSSSAL